MELCRVCNIWVKNKINIVSSVLVRYFLSYFFNILYITVFHRLLREDYGPIEDVVDIGDYFSVIQVNIGVFFISFWFLYH